ncbi:MAG: hypothetical protein WBV22_07500, partial [Anaerolineaceae bacterium]
FPLIKYFTRQVEEGRLQSIPPISAAQEFMGPMVLRVIASNLMEESLPFVIPDDEAFIDSHLKVFMDGIRNRGD